MGKTKKAGYKSVEKGAEYYNTPAPSDLSLNIYWKNLYNEAINLLPSDVNTAIADLGCGHGFFAKILYERGYRRYWGVDFSSVRIENARIAVPQFDFIVGNLYDDSIQKRFVDYDVFVLLETLEHLKKDIEVLEAIPKHKKIILSVPSVGGIGHVRRFKTSQLILLRYNALIDFTMIWSLSKGSTNKKFWLCHGTRR